MEPRDVFRIEGVCDRRPPGCLSAPERAPLHAALSRDAWFSSLGEELQSQIIANSSLRKLAAGGLVYAANDPPGGLFGVISGEVRLVHHTAEGKYLLYMICPPGVWFGEMSEFDELPRFHDAIGTCETTVLHLSHAGFSAIVAQQPRYYYDFARLLARHTRMMLDLLAEVKSQPVAIQLAQALISVGTRAGAPRLTQEALAAMLGVSRQTVNRTLKRWEQQRILDLHYGRVTVIDGAMLTRIASTAA